MHVRVRVGCEHYALPVSNVLEVAELGTFTVVPGAGRSVLGVRNLKGRVLPIVDLAGVFEIARDDVAPRLVVAELEGGLVGFSVDEVTDVAALGSEHEPTEGDYLTHAVLEDGRIVGVVDVERVFATLASQVAG